MYITIAQAAKRLQVSTKTIYRRIADGTIVSYRLGEKTIRIKEDEFNKYMDSIKRKG